MRVSVLGGDVEDVFGGVLDYLVSQLDISRVALLIGLLEQNGVQGRVELLSYVF